MALLDMAWRIDPTVRVITVDSGRLRQETYDFIEQVRERYDIPIAVFSPHAPELEAFVEEHGPNPFYRSLELRVRCCEIRKVAPRMGLTDRVGLTGWNAALQCPPGMTSIARAEVMCASKPQLARGRRHVAAMSEARREKEDPMDPQRFDTLIRSLDRAATNSAAGSTRNRRPP